MTDVNAAEGTEEATQEVVQPQAEVEANPSSDSAQEVSVENTDTSLNESDTADSKDAGWYEEQLKQKNAENKRRREKQKELKADNERLAKKLEELESQTPTLDDVNGDHDRLEMARQVHAAKLANVSLQKEDTDTQLQDVVDPISAQYQTHLDKANEQYLGKLDSYFSSGGTVKPEVFKEKAAIVNEVLKDRDPMEQAKIIEELARVNNTAEAVLNLADNVQLRYAIANGSMYEALSAIHKAENKPRTASNAPPPVDEVNGSGGIPPTKDPSDMSMSEYKAYRASMK